MTKYVLQLDVRGSNAPLDTIANHLPDKSHTDTWATEHRQARGTAPDGVPYLTAHIPYHVQADALDKHAELKGLNGVINSADSGSYIHVHECPTGSGSDSWDCSERIIEKTVS